VRIEVSAGLARGRVLVEEVPCRIAPSSPRARPLAPSATVTSHIATTLGVEAFVPRGARAEYGLLVVERFVERFVERGPDTQARLPVDVDGASASSGTWDEALCRATETAFVGLPREYASAVIAGLAEGGVLGGDVRVVGAAHGAIGSSPAFFGRLARWVVCLLAHEERVGLRADFDHAPAFRRYVVEGHRD
jgi:hypothetical protein